MALWEHFCFVLCVVLATFAQNTTGFAFGLLLLGLTGLMGIASVETVANVSSLLTLANAVVLVRRWPQLAPHLLAIVLGCSLLGVVAGVFFLSVIGAHERELLQLLLGVTIVACSLLLVVRSHARQRISGWVSFSCFAGISGIMGGLFSSAGPPLVYQLYRQPLSVQVIRDTLVVVFAANALARLGAVLLTQRFDQHSAYLALEAMPVVFGLTWFMRLRPPTISPQVLRWIVFALLLLSGVSLIARAVGRI